MLELRINKEWQNLKNKHKKYQKKKQKSLALSRKQNKIINEKKTT